MSTLRSLSLCIAALSACTHAAPERKSASPSSLATAPALATATAATAEAQEDERRAPTSELIDLSLGELPEAVAWVPASARAPIVVAVHGNRDRPEWQCWIWQRIVGDRAFVLCPRGVPRKDDSSRFTYEGASQLSKEIEAGVDALVAKYGDRVDPEHRVYAGHSLGANLGTQLVVRDPPKWAFAIFSEGGASRWESWTARAFAQKSGRRVLFACGLASCATDARAAVARGPKQLEGRVTYAAGAGHHFFGAVADSIGEQFDWLVEGDARFSK